MNYQCSKCQHELVIPDEAMDGSIAVVCEQCGARYRIETAAPEEPPARPAIDVTVTAPVATVAAPVAPSPIRPVAAVPPAAPALPAAAEQSYRSTAEYSTAPSRIDGAGRTRQFTGSLWLHAVIAVVITAVFYLAVTPLLRAAGCAWVVEKLADRGWTPYAAVLLSVWCFSVLTGKLFAIRRRWRLLNQLELPPTAQLASAEGIRRFLGGVRQLAHNCGDTLFCPHIVRSVEHYLQTHDVKEAREVVCEESDADHNALHASYTLVRVFLWAVPILGFIGTVLGVSDAIGGFGSFLTSAQEVNEIRGALSNVTGGLSVAFDTTFVALALSILIMIFMSAVEKRESDQLQAFEDFCLNQVLRTLSFQEEAVEQEDERQAWRELVASLHAIVPDLGRLQQQAVAAAEASAKVMVEAWTSRMDQLLGRMEAQFAALAATTVVEPLNRLLAVQEQIATGLEAQRQTLATLSEQSAQRRAEQEAAATALQELVDRQRQSIQSFLEQNEQKIKDHITAQHNQVQTIAGTLNRAAGNFADVLQVQKQLVDVVGQATGDDGMIALMGDIRGMMNQMQPALTRIAEKPLDVKVRFLSGVVGNGGTE